MGTATTKTLELTLEDTLAFDHDGVWVPGARTQKTTWFARVPGALFEGGQVARAVEEAFFSQIYGASWKLGNGDGSRYMPLTLSARELSDDEVAAQPWVAQRRTLYVFGDDGALKEQIA
jgi:hypothetical protein